MWSIAMLRQQPQANHIAIEMGGYRNIFGP
jgi:hypothetical protein